MNYITFQDDKVIIPIPSEKRIDFLSFLSLVKFSGWKDKNTAYLDVNETDLQDLYNALMNLSWLEIHPKFGVKMDDNCNAYYLSIEEKVSQINEEKRIKRERENDLRLALSKKQNGCGWCKELKRKGHGHVCEHTQKSVLYNRNDIELAFENWKETKIYEKPTPYPNAECPYIKYLEELKNGRKEEQPVAL